jgi:type IV pilus assembly protein PilY1
MSIKPPALKTPLHSTHLGLVALAGLMLAAVLVPSGDASAQCTQSAQNGCVELSASPAQDTVAVPPNIVLMLDDSGSMTWDVMPDYGYISGTQSSPWGINTSLVNATDNGVYYSPTSDYTPPPKADGTRYPNADFDDAYVNGFDTGSNQVNLSTYRGRYEIRTATSYGGVRYSYPLKLKSSSWNARNKNCPSGWAWSGSRHPEYCYYTDQNDPPSNAYSFWDMGNNYAYGTPCSNRVTDAYDPVAKKCAAGKSFFYYTTKNSSGSYVQNFVGAASGDCAAVEVPTGATCRDGAADRQHVANWFSYYHNRTLMAKSGVMTAFANLSANYRFGFGALNNRNSGNLPTPVFSRTNGSISNVSRFGNGTSGTIKAQFWNWLATLGPSGGTPLRAALQSAGAYFQTAQPWQTMDGDPNYVPGGSNTDELSCRSSYTILTTDGFWNGNNASGVSGAASSAGTVHTGPSGNSGSYSAVPPFSGGGIASGTSLADVAAYYWKTDLRAVDNLVPASKRDPAFWQHMTTFGLGIGWDPVNITPTGTTIDQVFAWADQGGGSGAAAAITGFSWPTPTDDSINNIADLAHASVVGHGDFFSAKNPTELAAGFARAIAQIAERNVAPQPRSANASVAVTGALSFDTGYNTGNWSGSLEAVEMKPDGSRGGVIWDLTDKLNSLAASGRKIFTGTYSSLDCTAPLSPKNGVWAGGKVFNASVYSSLDCWQQLGMNRPALLGGNDTPANRIDYLRGDATYEARNSGGVYRDRTTKLGAIIRSQPVYVSYPSEGYYDNWPVGSPEESAANGGNGYSKFVVDKANREGTVYIGANDGMLHAFSAPAPSCDYTDPSNPTCTFSTSGGNERWAYIPRAVYANLGNLTDANFVYRPTVDASPRTRDVFINGSWKTLLTGAVGIGGRGVFGLDVTDPAAFDQTKVLWEFDSDMKVSTSCVSNDGSCKASDLGYTTSTPYIGRLANGKWVVLVSSGYFPDCGMPDVPTNEPEFGSKPLCEAIAAQAPKDGSGKPYSALFVLDAATGAMIAELKTPTGISGVSSHGLGPVVLGDYESDQIDDVAFAGDLMGNLWRFDLTDADASKWEVTLAYRGKKDSNTNKQGVQPITSQPRLFPDPFSSRFLVVFGTGKYLGAGDNSSAIPVQTAYGIREDVNSSGDPVEVSRSQLKKQTLTEVSGSGALANAKLRKLTDAALSASDKGWYIDFDIAAAAGERVIVTPGAIFPTNSAVFTTMIPTKDNYCDPSTKGAVMMANAGNGGSDGGVTALGGGYFVGARVSAVATSGSTPMVSKLGGGGIILPMLIDVGGAGGGGGTTPPPPQPIVLDSPVWRRRSWSGN